MSKPDINVSCPNCGQLIDVDDILHNQIEAKIKSDYKQRSDAEKASIEAEKASIKLQQAEIAKQQEAFTLRLNESVNARVKEQSEIIRKQIKSSLEQENEQRIKLLNEELNEQNKKLAEFHRLTAENERLKREKDQQHAEITARSEKQYNEKLRIEIEALSRKTKEETELELHKNRIIIDQLKVQLSEAQRKAEQGSTQLQGEAQELAIEEWLSTQFPLDRIEEIKKGVRGGDCLQIVNTRQRANCGLIYYESKRTKEFQPAWIEKFRADMRLHNANIGVLVTEAMPKDLERMGMVEGIWICTFSEFKGLCAVLRESIIQLSQAIASQENKGDKMVMLYSYLTSNEFRMQIEGIVEGFKEMQKDLDKEKRAMQNIWSKRQKQLDKVLINTINMHGSIKGIAGNSIQSIKALELGLDDELDDDAES